MNREKLEKILQVTPSTIQKSIQRENFNAFIHYGLNTFVGKEWSDGTISPEVFNPSNQDAEQWVKVLKYAGAKGIIFTAKHHDGFCMWQTKTTEYSIKNSPYKDGKGDVVKEVSDACKKYGVKFGIYLSPWDRNSEYYGTEKYDDFYVSQLTELLTNYGEIFAVWLDGACGAESDGKKRQEYDFKRYYSVIRKLSPKTIISNCGPDVRWVGNENGTARKAEWNVIPRLITSEEKVIENSQSSENQNMKLLKESDILAKDIGSREYLDNFDDFVWSPAEVDVSIRPGWFYHKSQDRKIRSVRNLMNIYLGAVGGNSLLLLNVPPDRSGRISDYDVDVLVKFGDRVKSLLSKPVCVEKIVAPEHEGSNKIKNVLTYAYNKNSYDATSYYTPKEERESYEIKLTFDKPYKIDRMRIVENVAFSQRIENFKVTTNANGKEILLYEGETIGYNRIAVFNRTVLTDNLTLTIDKCRSKPYLEFVGVYETDGNNLKEPLIKRIFKK